MMEDNVYELLAPSAELMPLLEDWRQAGMRLAAHARPACEAVSLARLDASGFVDVLAHFASMRRGLAPTREDALEDLRLWCSETLGIMAPHDAAELFSRTLVEHPLERLWRRVTTPATAAELCRADLGRGWSGFAGERPRQEQERLLRLRRFCDRFRGTSASLQLKAPMLLDAAFCLKAFDMLELLDEGRCARARERVALELVVRHEDWSAFARAILFADTFDALQSGDEVAARRALRRSLADVEALLELAVARRPWQRVAGESFPPVCTSRGHTRVGL